MKKYFFDNPEAYSSGPDGLNAVSSGASTPSASVSSSGRPKAAPHAPTHGPTQVSAGQTGSTVLPEQALVDALSNPDAEFDLCGWLLRLTTEQLPTASRLLAQLSDEDVAHPVFRQIVKASRYYVERDQLVGAAAVLDYAHHHNTDVGGPEFLAQLIADPIGANIQDAHIEQCVQSIVEYGKRRKVRDILQHQLNELARKKPIEQVATELMDAAAELKSTLESSTSGPVHISEIVNEVLEDVFEENPTKTPISTGFEELDIKFNGGIRDGDYVILAGRPGMGKTAMGINGLGRNMSLDTRHRRKVLVFSLEMSGASLGSRMLSSEAGIPAKYFRTGDVESPAFHEALAEAMPRFAKYNPEDPKDLAARLWIDDTPGLDVATLRNRVRQFAMQYGPPIIIIDYLQLLAGDDPKKVGIVSGELRKLARELDTPIIALSQLNRSLESRTSKIPILSDLRESGNIEQDASIIMFVYRDVVYNPDTADPDEALVIVAKQRDGEVGPVPMRFNGPLVRYESRMITSYYPDHGQASTPANSATTDPASHMVPEATMNADYDEHGNVIHEDIYTDPNLDDMSYRS